MLPTINVEWPHEISDADYRQTVEKWKAIEDRLEGETFYRRELFPRSCQRIRSAAPLQPVALLFVPVGTQAYPPILACLGTPARRVVLLHTERSQKYAIETERALAGLETSFHLVQIDQLNPADIAQKLRSCYDAFGQPEAQEVCCDQTGGTKIMTSTVAGFAALNGWRQVYVHSRFMQARQGSYDEIVMSLGNLFEELGGLNRRVAWELASLGHYEGATNRLKRAMEESLASGQDPDTHYRWKLAASYRKGQVAKVRKSGKALARKVGITLTEATVRCLAEGPIEGFYYWVASTLNKESQEPAAVGALALIGIEVGPAGLSATLAELKKKHELEWALAEWKPLDDLLGFSLTREVRTRVHS